MPYRSFTDSRGTRWRAWDVVPTRVDRRTGIRRVRMTKHFHPERRTVPTRRLDMAQSRLFFPPGEAGWLCFESDGVRRRLRPIPAVWALEDAAGLERLCELAAWEAVAAE